MLGKLENKVAIVTGSSRGIGKGVAILFASEGAKVVVCGRTLCEGDHALKGSLDSTVSEIQNAGGTALAVQGDVSKEESCAHIVQMARQTFGPVDVLVNNAMWTNFAPIKDLALKRWMLSFAVNVQGPFMLSQKVLPDMIERGSGAIVNISSNGAIGPGRGPYKATSVLY